MSESLDWIDDISPRDAALLVEVWEQELINKTRHLQEGITRLRKAAGLDRKLVSGNYDTAEQAATYIRHAGATVHTLESSGRTVADYLGVRYWLEQVLFPGSPHNGTWYWYGPEVTR